MCRIAGAEQHDIDARFVTDETIRGVGHARRAVGMQQEAERIGPRPRHPAADRLPRGRRGWPRAWPGGRRCAGRRTSAACRRAWPCVRGNTARAHSGAACGRRPSPYPTRRHPAPARQHAVRGRRRGFGDADMAQPAGVAFPQQRGQDDIAAARVVRGRHAVQLEDIDVIGAQPPQRGMQAGNHVFRRGCRWRAPWWR